MNIYIGTQLGATKYPDSLALSRKVYDYVKCNPPLFAYVEPDYVELYFVPTQCELSYNRVHQDYITNKLRSISYVGTRGEYIAFVIAHELAHAFAVSAKSMGYARIGLPYDNLAIELYADNVAYAITGITRESWKNANNLVLDNS